MLSRAAPTCGVLVRKNTLIPTPHLKTPVFRGAEIICDTEDLRLTRAGKVSFPF
jgi:hypothetical protein